MRLAALLMLAACGPLEGLEIVDVPGYGLQIVCDKEGVEWEKWVCTRSSAYDAKLLWRAKETK